MFTPIYLSSIPIIHYIVQERVKGRRVNLAFPTIYSTIVVVSLLIKGTSSYSLSTISFLEGHYLPLILILDYHATCFLAIAALMYFYIVHAEVYVKNPYVLIILTASTLTTVSTDVLFSTLMLSVVLTYLTFIKKHRLTIHYFGLTLLSTTTGYLLTNSFNVYFIRFLTGLNYVNTGAACLGLMLYSIPYTLILFNALGIKPFEQKNSVLETYDKVILSILSVSILTRLIFMMKTLGDGFIYLIYVLFTAPLFVLNYVVNHVDYSRLSKVFVHNELYLLPVLLTLLNQYTYVSIVTIFLATVFHVLVNDVSKNIEALKVSKTLIPLSPGFVTTFTAMYSTLVGLPPGLNIVLTLLILFTTLMYLNNVFTHLKVELPRKMVLYNVVIGLTMCVFVTLFVVKAGEQFFNLSLYLRLIGV